MIGNMVLPNGIGSSALHINSITQIKYNWLGDRYWSENDDTQRYADLSSAFKKDNYYNILISGYLSGKSYSFTGGNTIGIFTSANTSTTGVLLYIIDDYIQFNMSYYLSINDPPRFSIYELA